MAWVGRRIMPHEPAVRVWLRRSLVSSEDVDDLIQEAYCKLSALDSIDHIERPDGYFFQIVRNLLTERMRRAKIVRFEAFTEWDASTVSSEEPSAERITASRQELARVQRLIAGLPDRCRRIFELRKIEGVPQKEIARLLGVSESTVENDAVKGMRLIMKALRSEDGAGEDLKVVDERPRTRKRD